MRVFLAQILCTQKSDLLPEFGLDCRNPKCMALVSPFERQIAHAPQRTGTQLHGLRATKHASDYRWIKITDPGGSLEMPQFGNRQRFQLLLVKAEQALPRCKGACDKFDQPLVATGARASALFGSEGGAPNLRCRTPNGMQLLMKVGASGKLSRFYGQAQLQDAGAYSGIFSCAAPVARATSSVSMCCWKRTALPFSMVQIWTACGFIACPVALKVPA
jgi:hypothetical protein